MIPRLKPPFGGRECVALLVGETGGAKVRAFEERFAEFSGHARALAFPYERMAFFALLRTLPRDRRTVLMPAFTCVVMADVASLAGATVRFLDVGRDANVTAEAITGVLQPGKGVLLLTELFGSSLSPADKKLVMAWAREKDIFVVEDKAMNLERCADGSRAAPACRLFSFMLNKQMSTVTGGMLCTNDEALYQAVKLERDSLFKKSGPLRLALQRVMFLLHVCGYSRLFFRGSLYLQERVPLLRKMVHYYDERRPTLPDDAFFRMSDFQAHVGLAQLKRVEQLEARRRMLFRRYEDRLRGNAAVRLVPFSRLASHPYFSILVPDRTAFLAFMRGRGVDVEHLFEYCIPRLAYYATRDGRQADYRNADFLSKHIVNLPLYPSLRERDVDRICRLVHEFARTRELPAAPVDSVLHVLEDQDMPAHGA